MESIKLSNVREHTHSGLESRATAPRTMLHVTLAESLAEEHTHNTSTITCRVDKGLKNGRSLWLIYYLRIYYLLILSGSKLFSMNYIPFAVVVRTFLFDCDLFVCPLMQAQIRLPASLNMGYWNSIALVTICRTLKRRYVFK